MLRDQRLLFPLVAIALLAACSQGTDFPDPKHGGGGAAATKSGTATVGGRTDPPAMFLDSLVDVPIPAKLPEGEVRLYRSNKEVVLPREFTGTVQSVAPGSITFTDGHLLLFGLPPGHDPKVLQGEVFLVFYDPDHLHFSELHSVLVTDLTRKKIALFIAQRGSENQVVEKIITSTLGQESLGDTTFTNAEFHYFDMKTKLDEGASSAPIPINTLMAPTIDGRPYHLTTLRSSLTVGLAAPIDGVPYHLFFVITRR